MRNNTELLAPAGSKESFLSAISAGADAVYVGLKDFSARSKAQNFSYPQLKALCDYAHNKNVKIFAAFNTLIKQSDIKKALKCLEQINSAGADAVIVQDLGIANISKKYFPKIKLHASTQLSVCNSYGVSQAREMGFSRAVLARELSLEQIKQIKNNSKIELEIFCHGALCLSVSGLCLFSSYIGGCSGNRGRCTQPCRRLWTVGADSGYFLSPKDLELADYIQELKGIGIKSFKIEGRMKTPDYVYKTVKAYRLLIDSDKNNFSENLEQAKKILSFDYARAKTSFNFAGRGTDIFEPRKSKNIGLYLGTVTNKTDAVFAVTSDACIEPGDVLRIVDKNKDKSAVLTVRSAEKNDRAYIIKYENLYLEDGFEVYKIADGEKKDFKNIFENLQDLSPVQSVKMKDPLIRQTSARLPDLFIRINDFKWINLLKGRDAAAVIKLTKDNMKNIRNFSGIKNYYMEIPPFIDECDLPAYLLNIDFLIKEGCSFFVNNISHFEFFKNRDVPLYAGQFMYALNAYAAEFLSGFNVMAFTASWEDDLTNISELSKILKNKLIVYLSGLPETVTSKMKFPKEIENKNIKSGKDEFKIFTNAETNVIVPRFPVSLFALKNNFEKLKINSFGIDLSYVSPNQNYLLQVLKAFKGQSYLSSANRFNAERKLK